MAANSKSGTPRKASRSAASTPKSTPSKRSASKKKTPSKESTVASADSSVNDTPASKYSSARSTPVKSTPLKGTPLRKTPIKTAKSLASKQGTPKKSKLLIKELAKKDEKSKSSLVKDALLKKAISELEKFNERKTSNKETQDSKKNKANLFEEDETTDHLEQSMDISFTFKKFLSNKNQSKQKLIELPSSLYPNLENFSVCLIIRDNIIKTEEELESVEEAKIPHLTKILPFKELYNEYKTFDQKRQLFRSYDLFIADEGIVTSLPSILGKKFYENHYKMPLPINILSKTELQKNKVKKFSVESVKNAINKIIKSTRYALQNSNTLTIPVGNVAVLTAKENLANLKTILSTIVEKFNDGKTNEIRSIFLKLRSSPALPLYEDSILYMSSKEDVTNGSTEDAKHESKESHEDEKVEYDGEVLDVKLSGFEKGLLELGQFESKPKFLETKVKKMLQKEKRNKRAVTSKAAEEQSEEPKKKKSKNSKK